MKLKIHVKEDELVFRVAVPVKESLDDKLRMYMRFVEKNEGAKVKKSEVMEKMIAQFIDEDKKFKVWADANDQILTEVQTERRNELEEKATKKTGRKGSTATKKAAENVPERKPEDDSNEAETSGESENVANFKGRNQLDAVDEKDLQKSDAPIKPQEAVM